MFSKSCEYGIKAMLHLAQKSHDNQRVSVLDIATAINSPKAFTGKIMQQLSKSGLVKSSKGPSGGFWISDENINEINLKQIVEVMDGDGMYIRCELGLPHCSDARPCPLHHENKKVRLALIKMHTETTLNKLVEKLEGDAILK